jgi:hypothetical protein
MIVFSHPLTIIICIVLISSHVECNHWYMCGFKLLILTSSSRSCPTSICCLITSIVQLLNWTSNECFKGHCRIISINCNSLVKFLVQKSLICLGVALSFNLRTLWIYGQPNNLSTISSSNFFVNPILESTNEGNTILVTNCFVISSVDQ